MRSSFRCGTVGRSDLLVSLLSHRVVCFDKVREASLPTTGLRFEALLVDGGLLLQSEVDRYRLILSRFYW